MEKTFFFVAIVLLSVSCNNEDVVPAKETSAALLTRISINGITFLEFLYDVEERLYRFNYYDQGTLAYYIIYEYIENGLKESRRYEADDHSLVYRTVFTLDNFGRVIKGENYGKSDFFDEVTSIGLFEYNGSDQLTVREFIDDGSSIYYREENTYDGTGNLITQQRTYYPNEDDQYIGSLFEFTPDSKLIPGSWDDYVFILELSSLDNYIRHMYMSNVHYKFWVSDDALWAEYNTAISGKEYDEDGNLTRQVTTRKSILGSQYPDNVDVMTYYQKEN